MPTCRAVTSLRFELKGSRLRQAWQPLKTIPTADYAAYYPDKSLNMHKPVATYLNMMDLGHYSIGCFYNDNEMCNTSLA
jgi:hypothetical protein